MFLFFQIVILSNDAYFSPSEKSLEKASRGGKFKQLLYYRLSDKIMIWKKEAKYWFIIDQNGPKMDTNGHKWTRMGTNGHKKDWDPGKIQTITLIHDINKITEFPQACLHLKDDNQLWLSSFFFPWLPFATSWNNKGWVNVCIFKRHYAF